MTSILEHLLKLFLEGEFQENDCLEHVSYLVYVAISE